MQKILTGVALLVGGVGLTWAMAGNGPARQPDQPCTNASHTACTHDHAHGWTSVLPYVEPPVDQLTDDAIRNYGRTPPNIEFNPYLVQHGITPRALTWSFVPDGTSIPAASGITGSAANSNLFSTMDTKFAALGGRATWIAQFQSVFDRWAALTGTSYTRITFGGNDWDDGAALHGSAGNASRGDIRISGRTLDGSSGVLAYNFFPSSGDMVIDTAESWGNSARSNSSCLRAIRALWRIASQEVNSV